MSAVSSKEVLATINPSDFHACEGNPGLHIAFGNMETVCKPVTKETHLVQCNWLCKN